MKRLRLGRISCTRSVSSVTIQVSMPSAAVFVAIVPATSSASKPGASYTGIANASSISRTRAICGSRSSGVSRRVAL